MPNETKNDFCCLIVSGFGAGSQAGVILRDHMCDSGIDTFLTTPSGSEELRLDKDHWVHGVRMEYLALRKQYQRVALVGLSLGGVLLLHMQDLKPAASIFVNTPCVSERQTHLWNRIFQSDLQPRINGVRAVPARHQLRQLIRRTKKQGASCVQCPVLVLQTRDDAVCDPSNAEHLLNRCMCRTKVFATIRKADMMYCAAELCSPYAAIFFSSARVFAVWKSIQSNKKNNCWKKNHSESTEWFFFYRSGCVICVLMRINSSIARVMCFFLRQ